MKKDKQIEIKEWLKNFSDNYYHDRISNFHSEFVDMYIEINNLENDKLTRNILLNIVDEYWQKWFDNPETIKDTKITIKKFYEFVNNKFQEKFTVI